MLGGPTVTGISDDNLGDAIRLAGANRDETAQLIKNYSISKNVYGTSIDVQNAKRILGTVGYNYIKTDKAGFEMPRFTMNDIVLGGTGTYEGIPNVDLNNGIRLAGIDRTGTISAVRDYVRNNTGTKTVYGSAVDITTAKAILGSNGYTYVSVDSTNVKNIVVKPNDIVLGGAGATGITDNILNGALRLAGADRYMTAQAINNYNSPKYVYGAAIDIQNAESILGNAGYTYICLDNNSQKPSYFTSNDIVLGGPGVTGISDSDLDDATRLAGANRDETAQLVKNYSLSKNVYGTSVDITNAKSLLGKKGYNYIVTDASGFVMPEFTCNDIILGGAGTYRGIPDVALNGARRLEGSNRDLTAQAIYHYAGIKDIPNQSWGIINRDPSQIGVSITVDGTGNAISIPKGTQIKVYSSDGDYYDCYYSGTNGVKILKIYLTLCSAPSAPSNSSDLGKLSAKYESNGDPGCISNGSSDPGGKSYGAWQLASKMGSVDSFLSWLKGINYSYYQRLETAKQNDGNTFDTNFDSCWRQIAQNDNKGFLSIQHDYIKYAYYDAAVQQLKSKYGFDISTKSFALQNVLWSTAVQHGVSGAVLVFNRAGMTGTDEQIINNVYHEREKVNIYFSNCSQAIKNAVYNRFIQENKDAIAMLKSEQ